MKAIVLCRFNVDSSDPIFKELDEDLDNKEIVDHNLDREAERIAFIKANDLYDYQPLLLDMKDISTANPIDKKHTSIRLHSGTGYIIKLPFMKFITIYQTLTGIIVSDFTKELSERELKIIKEDGSVIEL